MAQLQSTGITGSLTVTTGSATELLVTNTGVRIGNIISDTHTVTGSINISGSLGTVGTITATTLVVQTVTSSTDLVTGSTKFGTLLSNTHQFTGSVGITGSLSVNNTSVVTGTGTSGQVAYFSGTNGITGESNLFWDATNDKLGIGLSVPGAKLDIVSTGAGSEGLRVDGAAGGFAFVVRGGDTYTSHIRAGATIGANYFTTPPSNGLIVEGSVGIGTTTPVYPFNVVIPASASRQDLTNINRAATNFITFTNPQYSTVASIGLLLRVFPQSDSRQGAGIVVSGGTNNGATDLSLFTSTSPDGLASTSSADITITGNNKYVGISTTSPQNVLHVHGTSDGLGYIRITDSVTGATASDGVRIGYNSGVLRLQNYENSDIQFLTNNTTEAIRIKSDGNVGIGTTSPGAKLQVNAAGPNTIFDSAAATDARLEFKYNGTRKGLINWDSTVVGIQVDSGNSFYINGGNVGIGTTTPSASLEISAAAPRIFVNDTSTSGTKKRFSFVFGDIGVTQATTFGFENTNGTSGSVVMTINELNRVGIGTLSPATLLDIQGTDTDTYVQIRSKDTSISEDNETTRIRFSTSDTTYLGHIGYLRTNSSKIGMNLRSTDHIYLDSDSTGVTMMYLSSSGFVGIGTLAPAGEGTSKLYVNGAQVIYSTQDVNWGGFSSQLLIKNSSDAATNVGASIGFGSSNYGAGGIVNAFENTSTLPASYMAFHTRLQDGTIGEKVRITSNGNVGIGTTTPGTGVKLDVWGGNARFVATSSADALFRIISNNYATEAKTILFLGERDDLGMTLEYDGNNNIGYLGMNDSVDATGSYSKRIQMNRAGSEVIFPAGNVLFTNGSVGIGTTVPGYKLHVVGTTYFGGTVQFDNNDLTGVGGITFNDPGAGEGLFWNGGNGWAIFESPYDLSNTAGNLQFYRGWNGSSGTRVFTLDSSSNANFTGNVGIGITNPSQTLHLYTNFAATSSVGSVIQFTSDGAGGDIGYIGVNKGTGNGLEISVENRDIIFNTTASSPFGGNERMRITSGGRVGIGTTSPISLLDIASTTPILTFTRTDNATNPFAAINFASTSTVRWQIATNNAVGTGFEINQANGSTNRFYINTDGNVGINTTAPIGKLHVGGTSGNLLTVGTLTNDWGGDVAIGVTTGNGVIISKVNTNNDQNRVLVLSRDDAGGGGTVIGYKPSGLSNAIGFRLQSTGSSYFDGGNVGIGTTSPAYKLDVNGTTRTTDNTILASGGTYVSIGGAPFYAGTSVGSLSIRGDLYPGIAFYTGSNSLDQVGQIFSYAGTGNMILAADPRGVMNSTTMQFELDGSTKMLINSNGNVGIGTTAPQTELHVWGNSGWAEIRLAGSTAGSGGSVEFFSGSVQLADIYGGPNKDLTFRTNGVTTAMFISASGNVGIGTTTPGSKLQIIGANSAEGQLRVGNTDVEYSAGINFYTSTSNRGFVGWRHTNSGAPFTLTGIHLFNTDNSNIVFGTNNTVKAVINVDGNLGIGTTAPTNKFEITHTIASNTPHAIAQFGNAGSGNWANSGHQVVIGGPSLLGYTGLIIYSDNTTGSGQISFADGRGASDSWRGSITYDHSVDAMVFATNATEKVRITTGGNVGIGTDSPYTQLSLMYSDASTTTMSGGITIHNPQGTTGIFVGIRLGTYGANDGGFYPKQFIGARRDAEGAGKGDIVFANRDATDTSVVAASDIAMTIKPNKRVIVGGNSSTANGLLQITGAHVSGYGMLNMDGDSACIISMNGTNTYDVRLRLKYASADKWFAGMMDNDTFKFTDSGNVVKLSLTQGGTLTAAADVVAYSDARLKENIITVDNAVEKVLAMRGVFYNRIDTEDKSRKVGVIAQEIQEILPEVVTTSDDGTLGVSYGNIVGVLIEAIKELKAEIEELKRNK